MTIENLGVKLYSGTKSDRVSDSLGSSANGTNTGITLVTATSTAEQTTGAEENTLTPDTRGMGEYVVNTSSTLYGKTLTDVQFNIKKATGGDAPAAGEVVRARHYNSSNTLIHTYWTKDATTLPTSFAWTSETTLSGDTAYVNLQKQMELHQQGKLKLTEKRMVVEQNGIQQIQVSLIHILLQVTIQIPIEIYNLKLHYLIQVQ